jgi:hypothetical protein
VLDAPRGAGSDADMASTVTRLVASLSVVLVLAARLCLTDPPGFNPHAIPAGHDQTLPGSTRWIAWLNQLGYSLVSPPSHPGADADSKDHQPRPSEIHRTEPGAAVRETRLLFDAMPFKDWRVVGGAARFEVLPPADGGSGPTLVGKGPIDRNGFLASPRVLSDFRLAVEVRLGSTESPKGEGMNSGIQIRSAEMDGTIAGLQIEIDPTERRWSGGVYDERGRGWLAPLKDNAAAMAAFKPGELNLYEIECIGPRIRTRVNGVACAEWYDGSVSGLLAFQVHSGKACEVAFRAPVLEQLGAHAWREGAGKVETDAATSAWSCRLSAAARGVRVAVDRGGMATIAAADGTPIAEFAFAPKEAKSLGESRHRLEIVWIDGRGAALLDGVRIAGLSLAQEPAAVRLASAGLVVGAHAVLETTPLP